MNPTFPIGHLYPILFWTFWAQNFTFGLLFLGLLREITIFRSIFASLYNLHISKVVFNLDKGIYSLALILVHCQTFSIRLMHFSWKKQMKYQISTYLNAEIFLVHDQEWVICLSWQVFPSLLFFRVICSRLSSPAYVSNWTDWYAPHIHFNIICSLESTFEIKFNILYIRLRGH